MKIEDSPKIITHHLKTWPKQFQLVKHGIKRFEVRKNDRNYQVNDILILEEWDPEKERYTRDHVERRISYILEGGQFGIEKGYVVMQIEEVLIDFRTSIK